MKITFIIKNLTDSAHASLAAMSDMERFTKLKRWATGDLKHCVSIKYGASNAFRDRLEAHVALQEGKTFSAYSLSKRRGYMLASFDL